MDNAWLKMMFKMSTASLHTSWQTTTPLTNRWWRLRDPGWTTQHSIAKYTWKIFNYRLHDWSIAMEHAKNYEIRYKIIWNIRTKRVALFSGQWCAMMMCNDSMCTWKLTRSQLSLGQCNLRFLSTKVLQGSVATCVNYGRIFIDFFTANLLQSVMVKEFWKSVSISQSYRQK